MFKKENKNIGPRERIAYIKRTGRTLENKIEYIARNLEIPSFPFNSHFAEIVNLNELRVKSQMFANLVICPPARHCQP